MLTQEKLRELLHYDPDTGEFRWKIKKSKIVKIGEVIQTKNNGYPIVQIDKKQYYLHRLAFLYMEGYLPENMVDHINRIRDDNRWCNLREVSNQCNIRNSNQRNDTTSGVKGVSWHKEDNRWQAQICIMNKKYHFGSFIDLSEAVAHRLAAEQCLDWSGCDSDSPAYLYMKNQQKELSNGC